MKKLSLIIKQIYQKRMVQHILFWFTSYYILLYSFAMEEELHQVDYVYTFLFHLSLIAGVYINHLILIPGLLAKKRIFIYLPLALALWLGTAWFNEFTFTNLCDYLFPDYLFISYFDFEELLKFSFAYLGLTTLLKLAKKGFLHAETQKELEQIKRKQAENELEILRAQINPHFLFNNLNSLYALARKKAESTPEYILHLSEMMRYMLYETNTEKVELDKELSFVKNYLKLQQLRLDAPDKINYRISGAINSQLIAPLLLIPFVENSFKHGCQTDIEQFHLDLNITVKENKFRMELSNSKQQEKISEKQTGGIGLRNVTKRLEYLYPQKHQLEITNSNERFMVKLQIYLEAEKEITAPQKTTIYA
ncbi:MAG: sensor histidine kinase [Marinifilaceae bacterium]